MANSIFKSAFESMISARERQVRRYVNGTLIGLDDDTLKSIGRTRDQIRKEGYQPYGV
ncbi:MULTISPECIES: hypothetical protein [unclassified Lentilitoribacter]|jgi:uncharacterized protein YjiS (DUF1127 family)|uniref:hypothetical protein n=1 Tax=unclassified Lentilitoribacter TaxID=2647570 RepID=UPI00157588DB|nr:hypothetical protein [Lentilitoribacter sp. Alg239-R112]